MKYFPGFFQNEEEVFPPSSDFEYGGTRQGFPESRKLLLDDCPAP